MPKSTNVAQSAVSSEQHHHDEQAGTTPLARSLELNDQDVTLMGRLFNEATASLGLNGTPIFNRLLKGESIGQAMAIPDGVVEQIYTRAHSWFTLGRIDRAEPLFRALCFLRDEDADFWVGYGVCLRMTGQFSRAQQAFVSAANIRPDWAVPYFHALELALHQKQWDEARAALSAYDARASKSLDSKMIHEAERLRAALDLKRAASNKDASYLKTEPINPRP